MANAPRAAPSKSYDGLSLTHSPPDIALAAHVHSQEAAYDPVFGEVQDGDAGYRNTGWKRAAFLMMKTQVGIGSLSIPAAFLVLGLVPGVFVVTLVAAMTTWSNHVLGRFSISHPGVSSLSSAGGLMFGRPGEYSFTTVLMLFYIFTAGSSLVSVSTCFNALSGHSACTAVFLAVTAIIAFCLASVPKISQISIFAPAAAILIIASLLTVSVAVNFGTPAAASGALDWRDHREFHFWANPSLPEAMGAVSSIVFAFTGTPYFFSILTEMKKKEDYFKAMYCCQAVVYAIYLIVGVVVYYACGKFVTSPALGSAGTVIKTVAYGLALPALLITSMIVCHIPAKTIFIRALTGSRHLTSKTWQHWTAWLSCTVGMVLLAYLIASAIPNFGSLVSLVGALFGSIICLQLYGVMWWYDHKHVARHARDTRWYVSACWATFVIVGGCFCTVFGTWGAIEKIVLAYQTGSGKVWSCMDNSSSH